MTPTAAEFPSSMQCQQEEHEEEDEKTHKMIKL